MNTNTAKEAGPATGQNQAAIKVPEISGPPVFLTRVVAALSNADSEVPHKPTAKVRRGDVVLGVLTNAGLRGLYSLSQEFREEAKTGLPEKLSLRPSVRMATHEEHHDRAQKARIVHVLFQQSLRDLLGDDGYGDFDVIEGWQVVLHDPQADDPNAEAQSLMGEMVETMAARLREHGFPVKVVYQKGGDAGHHTNHQRFFRDGSPRRLCDELE